MLVLQGLSEEQSAKIITISKGQRFCGIPAVEAAAFPYRWMCTRGVICMQREAFGWSDAISHPDQESRSWPPRLFFLLVSLPCRRKKWKTGVQRTHREKELAWALFDKLGANLLLHHTWKWRVEWKEKNSQCRFTCVYERKRENHFFTQIIYIYIFNFILLQISH